jgi:ATP-dependent DNA ligase
VPFRPLLANHGNGNRLAVVPVHPAHGADLGESAIHEAKFDGFRAQIHISDGQATLYRRNGADPTKCFRAISTPMENVPAKSAIINEFVACGLDGATSSKRRRGREF